MRTRKRCARLKAFRLAVAAATAANSEMTVDAGAATVIAPSRRAGGSKRRTLRNIYLSASAAVAVLVLALVLLHGGENEVPPAIAAVPAVAGPVIAIEQRQSPMPSVPPV